MIDVAAIYNRFFALGGPPSGSVRPWNYRRKETSLRLVGCQLLVNLVYERQPRWVLDLGSGITSHMLRHAMRDHPDMIVITTDTHQKWLDMTSAELRRDGLNTEHCYLQSAFESKTWPPFDLISVDSGNLSYRIALAPHFVEWCAPHGILFLDDWRRHDYAVAMEEALIPMGFQVTEHDKTLDEFGMSTATAERVT